MRESYPSTEGRTTYTRILAVYRAARLLGETPRYLGTVGLAVAAHAPGMSKVRRQAVEALQRSRLSGDLDVVRALHDLEHVNHPDRNQRGQG